MMKLSRSPLLMSSCDFVSILDIEGEFDSEKQSDRPIQHSRGGAFRARGCRGSRRRFSRCGQTVQTGNDETGVGQTVEQLIQLVVRPGHRRNSTRPNHSPNLELQRHRTAKVLPTSIDSNFDRAISNRSHAAIESILDDKLTETCLTFSTEILT